MSRIRLATLLVACLGVLALPTDASAFGLLSGFGSFGEAAGQMWSPGNLQVAADGSVYVADFGNERIDVFSAAGTFERAFGKGVNIGGGDICTVSCQSGDNTFARESAGGMSGPEDIALGTEGNVFVADSANNRIDVFTAAGVFVRAFGSEVEAHGLHGDICTAAIECRAGTPGPEAGATARPFGVAFDGGDVYVADSLNRRIDVFTASGKFIFAFGRNVNAGAGAHDICTATCEEGDESAAAGAIAEPYSLEVAPDGNLYVADYRNDRIDVFSPEGSFLFAFGKAVGAAGSNVCTVASGCNSGTAGGHGGEVAAPTAVAIDPSGNVYVAEQLNDRIEEFTAGGEFVRAIGQGVVDGQAELEVCTVAAGCRKGGSGPGAGMIDEPYGVAVAAGKVYASEELNGELARVEVFGEPLAPGPPAGGESAAPPVSGPDGPVGSSGGRPTGRAFESLHARQAGPEPEAGDGDAAGRPTRRRLVVAGRQGDQAGHGRGRRGDDREAPGPADGQGEEGPDQDRQGERARHRHLHPEGRRRVLHEPQVAAEEEPRPIALLKKSAWILTTGPTGVETTGAPISKWSHRVDLGRHRAYGADAPHAEEISCRTVYKRTSPTPTSSRRSHCSSPSAGPRPSPRPS